MKKGLILLMLFSALHVRANDTLTRAQVYNFNVGDTFDYRHYTCEAFNTGSTYDTTISISYSRYVITNIFYSTDSLTKFIQRVNLFPSIDSLDTLALQNLSGFEVYLDTLTCTNNRHGITIDSLTPYHGRFVNSLIQDECSPGFEELIFADGLGIVLNANNITCAICYGGHGSLLDSTVLIYYAKGLETWGTPYYNFPYLIQSDNTSNKISLFPSLNNGTFKVQAMDAGMLPISFLVYDITGKKVMQCSLNEVNNDVNIGSNSAGVYIWKALSKNQVVQTGKMIIN